MKRFRRPALAMALCLAAPAAFAAEARVAPFAPHRAIYEMSLADAGKGDTIGAVSGRLVYEFAGSPCEGWASKFRMVTRLEPTEGRARLTDIRATAFEDAAGSSYDFVNENRVDGVPVETTEGRALRKGDAVEVKLAQPDEKGVSLPAAVHFPTDHLASVLDAAKAGKTIAEIDLYDGTDSGEKPYRTAIVIGRELTGADDTADEPAAANDLLKGHRRWPIDIAFYDMAKASDAAQLPDYRLNFLLYDNGVSRRMRFDYGSFVLKGSLASLEALPAAACR